MQWAMGSGQWAVGKELLLSLHLFLFCQPEDDENQQES